MAGMVSLLWWWMRVEAIADILILYRLYADMWVENIWYSPGSRPVISYGGDSHA
jgi:hypothetical protein